MKQKIDWVFWVQVKKRERFQNFWKSRMANCLEIQVFNYCISIGMPWLKHVIDKADTSYPLEGVKHFEETNKVNREGVRKHGRFRYNKA